MNTHAQERIARYFQALGNKDAAAWLETFAADGANHDPVFAPPNLGHGALREFFTRMTEALQEISISTDPPMLCGEFAAVKWRAQVIGHNGRSGQAEGLDVFQCNADGSIQNVWGFWDPLALFAQLEA